MNVKIFKPQKIICPDCGSRKFKKENGEIYCRRCGLIVNDIEFVNEDHTWETSNAPLSNGLAIESKMASIEKKFNWTSKSKKRYLDFRRNYYPLFADKLLELGFNDSEAWDCFNYNFREWYFENVPITNRRKREDIIQKFLESEYFERFDRKATVSTPGYSENIKILGYYDNITIPH